MTSASSHMMGFEPYLTMHFRDKTGQYAFSMYGNTREMHKRATGFEPATSRLGSEGPTVAKTPGAHTLYGILKYIYRMRAGEATC